jgi:dolichyl-phosphate-mannose--protein O-mannosyl transferase
LHKFYNLHKKRKIFKLFGKFFFIQYLLIVLIGFLLYAPLTYNKKIDISYMEKLIITDLWNLKADPYNYNNP